MHEVGNGRVGVEKGGKAWRKEEEGQRGAMGGGREKGRRRKGSKRN